eukprot:COSAG05_NODE_545_length_8769_cov_46.473702_4_plen_78_part_00
MLWMSVRPGTVVQCFVSCLISFFFVLLHLKTWPYPHLGANMLKLVTEVQICLVLLGYDTLLTCDVVRKGLRTQLTSS